MGEFYPSQLAEFAVEGEILPPNVKPDADEPNVARAIGKIMAVAFGGNDSIEVDGFTVTRTKRYSETAEKQVSVYFIADQQKAA